MKIKNTLKILEGFNYSINVERDYLNTSIVNGYMPTYRTMNIVHQYLTKINSASKKSMILSGAYGTGKSFLSTVILNLLSKEYKEKNLIDLYNKADKEYSDIQEIKHLASSYNHLIVFADDSCGSFMQSIVRGLNRSIVKEGINLTLSSIYAIISNKIAKWKEEYPEIHKSFSDYFVDRNIDEASLITGLNTHDENILKCFLSAYESIFGGEKFVALNSLNNMRSLLEEMEVEVLSKSHFDGIVYVFDEFGRYLETNISSIDVKEIQDMAEYCNDEQKKSAFLAIMHKDILQYSSGLDSRKKRDEWEKVSGRFHKNHLSYEKYAIETIIEGILVKNSNFEEYHKNKLNIFRKSEELLNNNKMTNGRGAFPEESIKKIFPLNYLAFKALPELSQKIAQNERTLFSFVCGDERNGLKNIIENRDETNSIFITLDDLYNYFEPNFVFLPEQSSERKNYITGKSIIEKVRNNPLATQVIKCLVVLGIYNHYDEFPPTIDTLQLALTLDEEALKGVLEELLQMEYIVYREHSRYYRIRDDISINVDREIEQCLEKIKIHSYSEKLNSALPLDTYYPMKYNVEHNIVRYIEQKYCDITEYSKVDKIFTKNADYEMVYLLNIENKDIVINEMIDQLSKNKIVIINENARLDIKSEIEKLEAIYYLEREKIVLLTHDVVKEELNAYKNELISAIEKKLTIHFDIRNCTIYLCGQILKNRESEDLIKEVSDFLENRVYPRYTEISQAIKYEIINKNKLSHNVKKVRTTILKHLMSGRHLLDEAYFNSTGAENSVARNLLKKTDLYSNDAISFEHSKFSTLIKEIIEDVKERITLAKLYEKYCTSLGSYGMRKGVFSFLLGVILIEYKNEVIIQNLKNREEYHFYSDFITELEDNCENYELSYVVFSEENEKFLDKIIKLLNHYVEDVGNSKAEIAFKGFRNFLLSLPKYVIMKDYEGRKISKILRGILAHNSPVNFWFKKSVEDYNVPLDNLFGCFEEDIAFLQQEEEKLIQQIMNILQEVFNIEAELSLKEFIGKLDKESIVSLIYQKSGDDRRRFIELVTEKVSNFSFYNWRSERDLEEFQIKLAKLATTGQNLKTEYKKFEKPNVVISDMGIVLKGKLIADIKNIGVSLSEDEKRKILIEILEM